MGNKISNHFRNLDEKDFRILGGIERLMIKRDLPLVDDLCKETEYSRTLIQKRLDLLHQNGLVKGIRASGEYFESKLTFLGYDALALNALVKRNIVSSIGPEIGRGKESEVHLVENDSGKRGVIKIHRLGLGSFKSFRRSRDYIAQRHRTSDLYNSRLSARREADVIRALSGKISVPMVWESNRHCVVMDFIEGSGLYQLRRLEKQVYHELWNKILADIRIMVKEGFIHGDLSPYNVLIKVEADGSTHNHFIIDWPQAVSVSHPGALEFLLSDLENLISFFRSRIDMSSVSAYSLANQLLA